MKNYEFELPDPSTQRRLADILWAMNDTRTAYQELIAATDELVKSQFMEQFSIDVLHPSSWKQMKIGEICTLVNGRAFKPSDWVKSRIPIVRIQNLNDPLAEYNYCDGSSIEDKYWIDNGTLLFSWSGTPGTSFGAFIWEGGQAVLNQHIFQVKPSKEISKEFLKCSLNGHMNEIIGLAHGGVGLRHITKTALEEVELVIPPLDVQDEFTAFVRQSDKSKFAAQTALIRSLYSYR